MSADGGDRSEDVDSGLYVLDSGPADIDADAPTPTCAATVEQLVGNDYVELVGEPLLCSNSDETVDCAVYKARIHPPPLSYGPQDDPTLDDQLTADAQVLLAIRAPVGVDLCNTRWVFFDNGGLGEGFGPKGGAAPGEVDEASAGFGDELIGHLNSDGYITVDTIWHCDDSASGPCAAIRDWVSSGSNAAGNAWFANSGGTGFAGVATREALLLDWIQESAGGKKLCAHAQSSGSGRVAQVLTRYGGGDRFEGIVFQGGPVFADIPWMCSIDTGTLGARPSWFQRLRGDFVESTIDCALSPDPNTDACPFDACRSEGIGATPSEIESLDLSSAFTRAVERSFADLRIAVVIGGADTSDASEHILLWLRGHSNEVGTWPPISAESLDVYQGYCGPGETTWNPVEGSPVAANRSCTEWSGADFPTAQTTYEADLAAVPHEIASTEIGATTLRRIHASVCPP